MICDGFQLLELHYHVCRRATFVVATLAWQQSGNRTPGEYFQGALKWYSDHRIHATDGQPIDIWALLRFCYSYLAFELFLHEYAVKSALAD